MNRSPVFPREPTVETPSSLPGETALFDEHSLPEEAQLEREHREPGKVQTMNCNHEETHCQGGTGDV